MYGILPLLVANDWPSKGWQVSHQRWMSGNIHHICLIQVWIRLPTLALKPRGVNQNIKQKLKKKYVHSKLNNSVISIDSFRIRIPSKLFSTRRHFCRLPTIHFLTVHASLWTSLNVSGGVHSEVQVEQLWTCLGPCKGAGGLRPRPCTGRAGLGPCTEGGQGPMQGLSSLWTVRQTDTNKNTTFPQIRWRAVEMTYAV